MQTFAHIGIYVENMDVSKKFYTEILDCKIIKDETYPGTQLCFLDAGGSVIELICKSSESKRSGSAAIDHLAFKVDSLDEKLEMLDANNIPVISGPRIVGSNRIAFFKGPNDERFEFAELYQK